MAKHLSDLAQTDDSDISYVDIYFPVSLLQVTTYIICFIIEKYFLPIKTKHVSITKSVYYTELEWLYLDFFYLQVKRNHCGHTRHLGLCSRRGSKKMRSYLPNALAFVFVVNVPNAGGLQDDRVCILCYIFIHFEYSCNLMTGCSKNNSRTDH